MNKDQRPDAAPVLFFVALLFGIVGFMQAVGGIAKEIADYCAMAMGIFIFIVVPISIEMSKDKKRMASSNSVSHHSMSMMHNLARMEDEHNAKPKHERSDEEYNAMVEYARPLMSDENADRLLK